MGVRTPVVTIRFQIPSIALKPGAEMLDVLLSYFEVATPGHGREKPPHRLANSFVQLPLVVVVDELLRCRYGTRGPLLVTEYREQGSRPTSPSSPFESVQILAEGAEHASCLGNTSTERREVNHDHVVRPDDHPIDHRANSDGSI